MLKFSEIFEFSKEKFRKIPILKEFEWFEWFEWFGPSPIEPFNPARDALRGSHDSPRDGLRGFADALSYGTRCLRDDACGRPRSVQSSH